MKNFSAFALFFLPLISWGLGNPIRGLFGDYGGGGPTGIRADCSYEYSGGASKIIADYDVQCMIVKKSRMIEVNASCSYENFKAKDLSEVRPDEAFMKISEFEKQMDNAGKPLMMGILEPSQLDNYITYLQKFPTGNLDYDVMMGHYCQRATPVTAAGAFQKNVDVPAEIISFWSKDYLQRLWGRELIQLSQKDKTSDFGTLMELNVQGAQLWEKILACAGGDPESARQQYAKAQFSCAEGSEIKSEVRGYIQSAKLYFSTSFYKAPDLKVSKVWELELAMQTKREIYAVQYQNLPSFHPLLSQAIVQMMVDLFPVGSSDRINGEFIRRSFSMKDLNEPNNLLFAMSQIQDWIPTGLNPKGLWPSASLAIHAQVQLIRLKLLQEIVPDLKVQAFDGIAFGPYYKLPDFYAAHRSQLADEVRAMNRRYGL